jgi:hypothetical protein
MTSTFVFLLWLLINIIFLFNFNLPVGYLVIVNLSFIVASMLSDTEPQNRI